MIETTIRRQPPFRRPGMRFEPIRPTESPRSPNPGFNGPVKQWALKALFLPAMRQGRAVRVYVNLPLDYSAPRPGS